MKINVTLWEHYHYNVTIPDTPTLHDIAMAIALEIHTKENKTKFTGKPRTYNYIMECLERSPAFNFRINTEQEYAMNQTSSLYETANTLQQQVKPIKIQCPNCTDKGCPTCNNHGFLISMRTYRVGSTQSNTLIIDLDNHSMDNLADILSFYEPLLQTKFRVIKTGKGFWLFGDRKYDTKQAFKFAHCQVLNPSLKIEAMDSYVEKLLALDTVDGKFKGATNDQIRKSSLYHGVGNFDIAFTFLSIKRERSTIRTSRKHPADKIELL